MQAPTDFAADLGRRLPHDWPSMIAARDAEIAAEASREERERCANKARDIAACYSPATKYRNTFIILAEWIESGVRP